MVTMNTKAHFIFAYFINTNMDIITVIAEKCKPNSPCDPHFIGHSPTLHTQCTPLSNITLSMNQCQQNYSGQFQIRSRHLVNGRTINASSIQRNLLSKFGKENLTSSNLNLPTTSTVHTTTHADPIQSGTMSQHIHLGKYTIHNSRLIEHISDDSDEEINITQGDIHTGQMSLLLLHRVNLPTMYIKLTMYLSYLIRYTQLILD